MDISELKFDEDGLIPAIVTDYASGAVLMLAYMNAESLKISIDEGICCFWSRSRKELWRKGETSGNTQHIVSIKTDCDKDTLLVNVVKDGPACHTGAESCFFEHIHGENLEAFNLYTLFDIIDDRKNNPQAGSYTTYLFEKGLDTMLKKIGEESTEVIIAGKADDRVETIYEIADLVYHTMVLMAKMDISPKDVIKELASRHGIGTGVRDLIND
ncbi:MAG: bifunctional phosphoribosyl-AMP cyclohydrolase/phosphoribosyl-ATP diphosphatase HisIE [Oscillospiraceae bacterium]|nr:bifunctional phosphoribosyl-AMP cyclohydrolase/phosphoribosyl-ATP diphosphatase HisIE [Oscillospiraceae bacterium]